MGLLIVGGTVVDLIFPRVPRLPAWPAHLEFTGGNLVLLDEAPLFTIGGNGANAAYVAGHCGAQVTLHSNYASDELGGIARQWLADAGCAAATSPRLRRTPVNVTAADARLRRATLFYSPFAPVPPRSAEGFSHALICGWPHPTPRLMARAFRSWRAQGVKTALDIGPWLGPEPRWAEWIPALAQVDLFISNEHEALTVTGARTLAAALRALRADCPGHLIVKLGAKGAVWLAPGETAAVRFRAPRVKARNTIGAGDSFNGALLAALDAGAGFPAALRAANRVAATVVASGRGVVGLRSKELARKPGRLPLPSE